MPEVLPVLLERLRNEITRVTTVKTFQQLATATMDMQLAPVLQPVVAKLCDFGVARSLAHSSSMARTQTGTPYYLSPEIFNDEAYSSASDMWSLGVVLYEMLAGVPPFQAETPVAVAYKHVQERPDGLIDRGVQVAESLQAITMKLLAKSPANRYPTADDLRNDLRRYLAGAHRISGKGAAAAGGAAEPLPGAAVREYGQSRRARPGDTDTAALTFWLYKYGCHSANLVVVYNVRTKFAVPVYFMLECFRTRASVCRSA